MSSGFDDVNDSLSYGHKKTSIPIRGIDPKRREQLHQERSIPTGLWLLAQGFRTLGKDWVNQRSTLKGLRKKVDSEKSRFRIDRAATPSGLEFTGGCRLPRVRKPWAKGRNPVGIDFSFEVPERRWVATLLEDGASKVRLLHHGQP